MGFSSLAPPFPFLPSRLSLASPSPSLSHSLTLLPQHEGSGRGRVSGPSSGCRSPLSGRGRCYSYNLLKTLRRKWEKQIQQEKRQSSSKLLMWWLTTFHYLFIFANWLRKKKLIRCSLPSFCNYYMCQRDSLHRMGKKNQLVFIFNNLSLYREEKSLPVVHCFFTSVLFSWIKASSRASTAAGGRGARCIRDTGGHAAAATASKRTTAATIFLRLRKKNGCGRGGKYCVCTQ